MRLQRLPGETELRGRWVVTGNEVSADETAERIRALTSGHLQKVATDNTGRETLYRDPCDGRYWELTYPLSEMHGGPPTLRTITPEASAAKYRLRSRDTSGG